MLSAAAFFAAGLALGAAFQAHAINPVEMGIEAGRGE
jgi:hypothetical protein